MMRPRLAPIAARTVANSCCRAVPRAKEQNQGPISHPMRQKQANQALNNKKASVFAKVADKMLVQSLNMHLKMIRKESAASPWRTAP